jgi:AraC family transcriptional regulator
MSRIANFTPTASIATGERLTRVSRGLIVPVTDAPLLTSANTPWSGFLLEIQQAPTIREGLWYSWHRTHVSVVTRGNLSVRLRGAGGNDNRLVSTGDVLIFPKGFGEACVLERGDLQLICVEIDSMRVAQCLGRKGSYSESRLAPQFGIADRHIAALLTNMASEVASGCPAGRLYGQSLSLSLAAYLDGRFAKQERRENRVKQRFLESQFRPLIEHIQANLASDLNLSDLADLVDMSSRQFFRLFSNTFGVTPHRYVTNQRVARAKDLLAAGMSLVDIAHLLGFASQSHFTDVFSKTVGISPGRFRMAQMKLGKRSAWSKTPASNIDKLRRLSRTPRRGKPIVVRAPSSPERQ